jgi:hypothetical protein
MFHRLLSAVAFLTGGVVTSYNNNNTTSTTVIQVSVVPVLETVKESCIQFSVGSGTGCEWMCNYCANQLQTTNYYFTDGVCTYQTSGCVGNPLAGKLYTCCAV